MAIGDGQLIAADVVLLNKLETTYGSDPTLAAANAFLVDRVIAPNLGFDTSERKVADGSTSPRGVHIGASWYDLNLVWALRGSGTVDTPPEFSPTLQACGLTETINAATDVTYTSVKLTSAQKSCAYTHFLAGDHSTLLLGARGAFSMEGSIGQPVMVTTPMKALYAAPTNAANPGSEVYDATQPPIFMSGSFAFASGAYKLRSFKLASNPQIAERRYVGATYGIGGFLLTEWQASGEIVIELDSAADKIWFSHAIAGTLGAFDMTVGATAGNKFDIDVPACKLTGPPVHSEDAGLCLVTLPFQALGTSGAGDAWLTLKHY